MKEKIRKEYYRRIRMITKYELNAINRMEAINTLATTVVTYSFYIVNWKMEEIRKLIEKPENYSPWKGCTTQEQTRKECTSPEIRAVEVWFNWKITYKTATINLDAYLNATKNDPLLVIAKEHEKAKKKYPVAS